MRHLHPRLAVVLPELADEVRLGLIDDGAGVLVPQVDGLRIVRACGCGDGFCASFTTTPEGRRGGETVVLTPYSLLGDVVDGRLVFIEVLDRPEVRAALTDALGPTFFSRRRRSPCRLPRPRRLPAA